MADESGNTIRLENYSEPGLHLTLKDSTRLILTRDSIESIAAEYWADPSKIPPAVKKAVDFRRCQVCPLYMTQDLCDALRPTLPLLDIVDKFASHDPVLAVYKPPDAEAALQIADTTMMEALRYLSIPSLKSDEVLPSGPQVLEVRIRDYPDYEVGGVH